MTDEHEAPWIRNDYRYPDNLFGNTEVEVRFYHGAQEVGLSYTFGVSWKDIYQYRILSDGKP